MATTTNLLPSISLTNHFCPLRLPANLIEQAVRKSDFKQKQKKTIHGLLRCTQNIVQTLIFVIKKGFSFTTFFFSHHSPMTRSKKLINLEIDCFVPKTLD
jgi:hypothetical protein